MPTPVSGSGSNQHIHETSGSSGQRRARAATSEEVRNQPAQPGSRQLALQNRAAVQQAIATALAMGSNVAMIEVNGQFYYFDLGDLSAWGFPVTYSQHMEGWGNVPGPQSEGWETGYEEPWGMGGSEPMSGEWGGMEQGGGAMRGSMMSGTGGAMRGNIGGPGGWGGGGYGGYGGDYGYGGMGQNQFMWDTMVGGQMREELYAQRREIRRTEHMMKVKMRMVMFLILMGDVVGAVRAMVFESERQNRMFNRLLVKQLNRVREAKSKILLAMGRKHPPRAHDNTNDPAGAARDQNRQAKYTQWVSVTTQLMSEVQNTERQLMDLLSEGRRNVNELWEGYSGLKEAEARTTRTILQSFRG